MRIKFQLLAILENGKELVTWACTSAWRALARARWSTDRWAKRRRRMQMRPACGLAFWAIGVPTWPAAHISDLCLGPVIVDL